MEDLEIASSRVTASARLEFVVVLAAFGVQVMVFGVLYGFGVVLGVIETDLATTKATAALIPAMAAFTLFMSGPVTGRLRDTIGVARLVGAGAFLLPAGLILTSWADRPLVAVVGFGLVAGLAASCVYVPLVSHVVTMSGDRSVLYAGIVTAGATLGPALSAPVLSILVDDIGWRSTYRLYAVVAAVVLGLAALLMAQTTPESTTVVAGSWTATVRGLASNRSFVTLYLAVLAVSPSLYVGFLFLPSYAADVGLSPALGARLVTVLGLASASGRVGLAALSRFVSPATVFRTSFGLLAVSSLVWLGATGSQLALYLSAAMAGVGYGGFAGLAPTIVATTHGTENLGSTLGVLYTSLGLGGLVTGPAVGAIIDHAGYRPALVALSALAAAAAFWLPGSNPQIVSLDGQATR